MGCLGVSSSFSRYNSATVYISVWRYIMSKQLLIALEHIRREATDLLNDTSHPLPPTPKQDVVHMLESLDDIAQPIYVAHSTPSGLAALARAGHDMRGALHRVVGHSMLLSMYPDLYIDETISEAQRAALDAIYVRAEALLKPINTVVMYAKLKTGQLKPVPAEDFTVYDLVIGLLIHHDALYILDETPDHPLICRGPQSHLHMAIDMLLNSLYTLTQQLPKRVIIDGKAGQFVMEMPLKQALYRQVKLLLDPMWAGDVTAIDEAQQDLHSAAMLFHYYHLPFTVMPSAKGLTFRLDLHAMQINIALGRA